MSKRQRPNTWPGQRRSRGSAKRCGGFRGGTSSLLGLLVLLIPLFALASGVSAQTPVTSAAPVSHVAEETISVYFLRTNFVGGKQVATAHRDVTIPASDEGPAVAIAALLAGPTPVEEDAGLVTGIPDDTEIHALAIGDDGVATIDVSATFTADDDVGLPERLAQVVYTLTQFPSIAGVRLQVDGSPPTVEFDGIAVDEAIDRADFEAQTPPIFVESPTVGDTVMSPVHVSGTANTFEGQFQLKIVKTLDGEDVTLAEMPVTTSGSGTRGPFEVTVDFAADASGPGTLVVFQIAASGAGDVFDMTEIPLTLEP